MRMPHPSLEKIVQEEVPILRKGYSYLRSAVLGLALSVSLHAQLSFTQTASTTLTSTETVDQKVIGVAIKNDGFADNIYVAAGGNVQKYDASFINPISSNIINFVGTPNYMNSGLGNTITFSTPLTGLRDIDATTGLPTGISYGPSTAFSISKQVVSGGNTYQLWFDTASKEVLLYNKTVPNSTFLFSSTDLDENNPNANWLVDFAEVDTTDIMNSNFIAARQDGFIEEVNLTNGLTGNVGFAPVISGGQLVGMTVRNGTSAWASYDANAGDFGAAQINYGNFAGYSPPGQPNVPEPATYGATFLGVTTLIIALRRKKRFSELLSKIKTYRIKIVNTSDGIERKINGSVSLNDENSVVINYGSRFNEPSPISQLNVTYLDKSQNTLVIDNLATYVPPRPNISEEKELIVTRK